MTGKITIETASGFLASKPLIGGGSTAGVSILSIMDTITPYLEFTGLILGLMIGLLTVYGLYNKNIKK